MSELIIEMEMPKDCPMCPMAHYNNLCEFTGCEVAPNKRYAIKTNKAYAKSDCRPSWCPIKGVLPDEHGDLIDTVSFMWLEAFAKTKSFDSVEAFIIEAKEMSSRMNLCCCADGEENG